MIKFLFKGILRDRSRSLLPIIIVSIGVMLTIILSTFIKGILGDAIDMSANFMTGHVKVMTKAYAENNKQMPNDLCLLDVSKLKNELRQKYPKIDWAERIHFAGLLDVPDNNGETKAQGPTVGQAIDFLSSDSKEPERMNIQKSIVSGLMPAKNGDALLSDAFAKKLGLDIGNDFTLFSSTANGSMAFQNFTLAGTVSFGNSGLDKGSVLIDIVDAQRMLDMQDAAGELLGFFKDGQYHDESAETITKAFNTSYHNEGDEFSPIMFRLKEQNNLGSLLDQSKYMSFIMMSIFIFAMSIVLWNTGLLGGLRRYAEFGVRLALGEEKKHIFGTILIEALMIGIIGSGVGTCLGLAISLYLQEYGIDFSNELKNSSMMLPSVHRAKITSEAYYIGFIPGIIAIVLGNALSGIGIFKRQTAQLFKELEV